MDLNSLLSICCIVDLQVNLSNIFFADDQRLHEKGDHCQPPPDSQGNNSYNYFMFHCILYLGSVIDS